MEAVRPKHKGKSKKKSRTAQEGREQGRDKKKSSSSVPTGGASVAVAVERETQAGADNLERASRDVISPAGDAAVKSPLLPEPVTSDQLDDPLADFINEPKGTGSASATATRDNSIVGDLIEWEEPGDKTERPGDAGENAAGVTEKKEPVLKQQGVALDRTVEGTVPGSTSDLSLVLQPHLVVAERAAPSVDSESRGDEQNREFAVAGNISSGTGTLSSEPLPVPAQLPSPILNIVTDDDDDVAVPITEQQGSDVRSEAAPLQTAVAGDTVAGASSQTECAALNIATDRVETLNITANQTEVVLPSAPAQLNLTETVQLVRRDREVAMATTTTTLPLYPRLDSITRELDEELLGEELVAFSEEELTSLYPNPQLAANQLFVSNFLQSQNKDHHELYELLQLYLKARLSLANAQAHVEALRKDYSTHEPLLWKIETKQITSAAKCGDGVKVSHSHSHKVALFNPEAAIQVNMALKTLREVLQEELCMKSYSSQLARIHIDHYLFQLLQSTPELASVGSEAPITSWIPHAPPGNLDYCTSRLRDCISVLFMFERRPARDREFSRSCRQWLDLLLSSLLRVASLSDHQFIFNHVLRCPPGVGRWGGAYLQLASPLVTNQLLQEQFHRAGNQGTPHSDTDNSYIHDWGIGMGLYRDWGGPLLDHFVTMLATLLLPIREREAFLALLEVPAPEQMNRANSQPWTFVDEDLDEDDCEDNQLLLKESDFIAFFDQFPFTDVIRHILQIPGEDSSSFPEEYSITAVSSHTMLRLLAFCTCLIRLLGAAFSTLRLSRYKEFIKQVGRTIRQTVQYVADYWIMYKSHRLDCGDTLSSLPQEEGEERGVRYSLNRLQAEFDQFVLRATRWILTAHKLGAWQFLADMPYGSVSLPAIWRIFWSLYSNQMDATPASTVTESGSYADREVVPEADTACRPRDRVGSLSTVEEITQAMKDPSHKAQFVDCLMKTYTSEAVFLLTTFVNMARSRSVSSQGERLFIDTIALEIFECTQVTEFARDAYSRTGCSLLDTIAVVHPCIISTLMKRVESAVGIVGENCILLFKELHLNLWVPESRDLHLVHHWLVQLPLSSHESKLARVILSGLNWGIKSEDGSTELVLEWSVHRSVALSLVEAHANHLSSHPGGREYSPHPSGISKYTASLSSLATLSSLHARLTTSSEQSDFVTWAWEIVLMLKLHPNQVLVHSTQMLSPSTADTETESTLRSGRHGFSSSTCSGGGSTVHSRSHDGGASGSAARPNEQRSNACQPAGGSRRTRGTSLTGSACLEQNAGVDETAWRIPSAKDLRVYQETGPEWNLGGLLQLGPEGEPPSLPDLTSTAERELSELRDAVKYEGRLAYYVAMCLTSIGTDTDRFLSTGLSMLTQLIEQGYYLPALRVLANVTPRFFKHRKVLLEEPSFLHVVIAIANADHTNASLRERITFSSPAPLILRKLAALIKTQLRGACGPGGIGGDTVLQFWIHLLLAYPNWHREWSVLYLLDVLSMAAFSEPSWQRTLQSTLLEGYKLLQPTQARRSSILSSVISIVGQEGKPPSLFNAIPTGECPWLAYNALCSEEQFEDEEGIWKALLRQLKRDPKASVDSALKKAFGDLKLPGAFSSSHLCIYRWAEFCVTLDHTHPICPLVWQRFFMLYLQRPILDSSKPERESFGLRFFAPSRAMAQRRQMKTALSTTCKKLQERIGELEREEAELSENAETLRTFLPKSLSFYQTLRLWLEEPRLHDASLHLPGLPQQYEPNRLAVMFQPRMSAPWVDFVPVWEVKGQLNSLVDEWIEVAAYQKTLSTKTQQHETSIDTAITRIQKRLQRHLDPLAPPNFQQSSAPFNLVPEEVLLSKDALLAVIMPDVHYIAEQARIFCAKSAALLELDSEYMAGVPEQYTNDPRQFHVRVPCHSRFNRSHHCDVPATIVFRFNEMTVNPKWEQRLGLNRGEYNTLLTSLTSPIARDLCTAVMRMEHTVAELSRLASSAQGENDNAGLECGIALFYEILRYINAETRQFPPSCQFLTSCVQILGQEFVQRDPRQTGNILDLLLAQRGRADLLAPLFQPNTCPEQFLHMYGITAEVAMKEGPTLAFSVLTKFNISSWLESYNPSSPEQTQLLTYISQGLTMCGPKPTQDSEVLVEVYRHHFRQLVNYQYPEHYNNALLFLIGATDNGTVIPGSWTDFCQLLGPREQPEKCRLGLQLIQESARLLASHYLDKRTTTEQSLYSLIDFEYIPFVGQFLGQLCHAMIAKWEEAVSMNTASLKDAIMTCWRLLVDMFVPWIATLQFRTASGEPSKLYPSNDVEWGLLSSLMEIFVGCVSAAQGRLRDPANEAPIMGLLWQYYCTSLALPNTPHHVMHAYHTNLVKLPWSAYLPDLAAIDSMTKLKTAGHFPPSSFVFLGRLFPVFPWKNIVATYCAMSPPGDPTPLQLHFMLLKLLVMLAAEKGVMDQEDTKIPELIAEAQDFHWEFVDAKMYHDVLQWQQANCKPTMVLHAGSCLSLALRLLKAAAGFPTSSGTREHVHPEMWEKRLDYVLLVVELIGSATHSRDSKMQNYSEAVSHLFQTAVDICVHEPHEQQSPHMISLLQEILNLFNTCSPSGNVLQKITNIIFAIFEQMPNTHFLTLPAITAGCRTLASLSCMAKVVEHCIEYHFKALVKPESTSLELPRDVNAYGWQAVTLSLIMPEASLEEFCQTCVGDCAALTLHSHILQTLPQCTGHQQEFDVAARLVQWCSQMKPTPSQEAKIFLLWEKALSLLLRQVRFGGNFTGVVPLFTSLATGMTRFGEDKASEGILGAIGLGKKSCYSHQFRLLSRAMAAFLHCQMPMDSSQTTKLRVVPNATGHVKDPTRNQQSSRNQLISGLITPTKLGDQSFNSLESLLNNKHYAHLKDKVSYAVNFVSDSSNCIMNSVQLLVYLCISLYPDDRFLDVLRVNIS